MPHDGSIPKQTPNLDWFGKLQSDIAHSAAGLAGSKALAQLVTNLNASMKLSASPYIDFKNSGVMQALNQVQTSANAATAYLEMHDGQTLKAVEAMRRGMNMGIDSTVLKQMTGAQTSITALAKIGNPLLDISAVPGIGQAIPPKHILAEHNFSAVTQAITGEVTLV